MLSIPRVATTDGMRTTLTSVPLMIPTMAPTATAARIASIELPPASRTVAPATPPAPMTEPNEMSSSPSRMTNVAPMAGIP